MSPPLRIRYVPPPRPIDDLDREMGAWLNEGGPYTDRIHEHMATIMTDPTPSQTWTWPDVPSDPAFALMIQGWKPEECAGPDFDDEEPG